MLADVPRARRAAASSRSTTSRPRAGWRRAAAGTEPEIVDRFARFCERAVAHLGDLIAMGCTINEPNVVSLIGYVVGAFPPGLARLRRVREGVNEHLDGRAPHARTTCSRPGRGDFPVGLTVAMGDWWAPEGARGRRSTASRHMHEGQFLEAARGDDFVGVQAYSRTRLDERRAADRARGRRRGRRVDGLRVLAAGARGVDPPRGRGHRQTRCTSPRTASARRRRRAASRTCTEALEGVGRCLADGLDVRGYFYWSLLDNFEWA